MPEYKSYALQCRAIALLSLASTPDPLKIYIDAFSRVCTLQQESLLRTAAADMEAALAVSATSASSEIANQYFNLSTHIVAFENYQSLFISKQVLLV